jgi:uncharacterized membrane protein YgaE (UPF0421/DUF939 family)
MRTRTTSLHPGSWPAVLRGARNRLRSPLLPIMQTAASAVVAWYLAVLVVGDAQPSFAAIAAVISLGATYGQRGQRAAQLVGGVILGITLADLIVHFIGSGPLQVGLMVLLAMSAAVALGGGELLVSEAAVSAILLVALDPGTDGFSFSRVAEAAIGGGVAFTVSSLLFPPDPALQVARATQSVFATLGNTLQRIAQALSEGDEELAVEALTQARATDALVATAEEALRVGRETARLAPPRRRARPELDRYSRSLAQVDFAVRDTRVLGRHAVGALRAGAEPSEALAAAVKELAEAVWELAAAYDKPERAAGVRQHAVRSAALAAEAHNQGPDLPLSGVISQTRSTAADLVRAAELLDGTDELPTEELLTPEAA